MDTNKKKNLSAKQFTRLAGQIEQIDIGQLAELFAEIVHRQIAAAASSEIAIEEIFSVKEAADYSGVCDETVRRWCDERGIGRQISGVWVVSGLKLEAFIKSREGIVVMATPSMPDAPQHKRKKSA